MHQVPGRVRSHCFAVASCCFVVASQLSVAAAVPEAAPPTPPAPTANPAPAATAAPPPADKSAIPGYVAVSPTPATSTTVDDTPPLSDRHTIAHRSGLTLEGGLSAGWAYNSRYNGFGSWESILGGVNFGIGAWLSPRLALTARVVVSRGEDSDARIGNGFLGPCLQHWLDDALWLSAAAGFAASSFELAPDPGIDDIGVSTPRGGFGFDLRAGYALHIDPHAALHFSFEVTPWRIEGKTSTNFALVIGLQVL